MSKQMSSIDWEDFDSSHPAFERISQYITIHSRKKSAPAKSWHVPGWIGREDLICVYGTPEAGKGIFAVDIACRLAAGMDFEGADIGYPRNVVYIAAERAGQVHRRVDAFCKHHGGERFDNLIIYSGPVDLAKPDELMAIVRSCRLAFHKDNHTHEDVDVVIIDTLSAAMSISDSNVEGMAQVVRALAEVTREANGAGDGATVIVIHHAPANGEPRMRGASQLLGAADTTIAITKKRGASVAQVVKNNETQAKPTRAFKVASVVLSGPHADVETIAPVLVATEAEALPSSTRIPRATRAAVDLLRTAIAENDNRPVTEEQWRTAVYAEAGEAASDATKRQRFARNKKILTDGLATETSGLFALVA